MSYVYVDKDGAFRAYDTPQPVGPGAPGEFALMTSASPEQLAALGAAAPQPRPTPRQWLERLPQAKQDAIFAAALANATILQWLFKASGTPRIDVTAPETVAGIAAMVAAGVITAQDQATLLAP